jgi:hypothetical protein
LLNHDFSATGANPTTSEFTTTTPVLYVCNGLERFFEVEENIFVYKTLSGVLNIYMDPDYRIGPGSFVFKYHI